MARQPSLRSQLNQIRAWVRQGRTNAWIAHQLDISVEQLERFREEHDLAGPEQAGRAVDPLSIPVPEVGPADEEEDEDNDVEDEDSDAKPAGSRTSRSRSRSRSNRDRNRSRKSGSERGSSRSDKQRSSRSKDKPKDDDGDDSGKRRRGRRGGRRRRKVPTYEATFDQGQEGYGFWLDPAIVDNPVYVEHWAGQRAIEVRFDSDSITIRKSEPGSSEKNDS